MQKLFKTIKDYEKLNTYSEHMNTKLLEMNKLILVCAKEDNFSIFQTIKKH